MSAVIPASNKIDPVNKNLPPINKGTHLSALRALYKLNKQAAEKCS